MKSHFYLLRTSIKNRFKDVLRKPGKLVLYLLIVLGFIGALAASLFGATQSKGDLPASYLLAVFFAFLTLFYGMAIQKGLASGDAIFEMNDVNLLFVSPVNPRATLLYGIIRLAGMSFWAGFFILFQSSTLANFGVGFGGVLILFVAFILNMMVLTLLTLVIYSITNGKPVRKRIVRIFAVVIFFPLIVSFITGYLTNGDFFLSLNNIIASPILAVTPFIGWASAGAISLINGNLLAGFGWLALLFFSGVGMLLYIMLSRSDYYEDALVATETAYEKKRAAAEGDVQATGSTMAKVKVKKTGLSGKGAHVFLYKHLRETFRKNRFGFFSMYTIITAGFIIGASIFVLNGDYIITVLQVLMWIQIFMIGTGRGLLEIYSHYLYMIPSSPFKKAVWSNMELIARTFVESVLFLCIPGLLMRSNPIIILCSMLVYVLFSFLLLGVNYLSMRWTETNISQGIEIMIYFFVVVLFMAPGLVAALIIGYSMHSFGGTVLALLILSGWELTVAFVCFALSKNILHNCDMPSMKQAAK